jgi:uncharacterized membrane protein
MRALVGPPYALAGRPITVALKIRARSARDTRADRGMPMDGAGVIALWAVLFLAGHFVLSAGPVRAALVGALGEQPFRGIYSLVALATFIPLVVVFAYHKHAGVMLWNLRGAVPIRWLVWVLMLAALVIIVASFITPNPAQIGAAAGPDAAAPRGILKLTRHPSFVALGLFGIAHILMNGWAGDIAFFVTFPVLGIVGGWHQDRRKLREMGERYRRFVEQTSFMPGAALLSGRQRCDPAADIPWLGVAIGVAAFVVLIALHHPLFGGYPMG